MRKTKIICTLGPASDSEEGIRSLIQAGANIFRLNMSHASHDWVRAVVPRIRKVASEEDRVIAILLDTQGPAIRTGDLPEKYSLNPGDILEFTVSGSRSSEAYNVSVNYDGFIDDIAVGDTVLVDNGMIHMQVLEKTDTVRCRVLTAGLLGSRRHINLPGVKVNLPPLTEKDVADVNLGTSLGVDYVALSFCREANDVRILRKLLQENGSNARIIAKIEEQHAVKHITSIIDEADIIMVARGDLGIECAMEDLPIIQRKIVKECLHKGRPVIVATHMLESMITNPVPTRAEVTDVANAVFEQADAIMLSGESATGKYPAECVNVLHRVAKRIERSGGADYAEEAQFVSDRQRTINSAVVLANSLANSKLVVFTRRGNMADLIAARRPKHSPIFAFTPYEEISQRIMISWGVMPILMPFCTDPNATIADAEKELRRRNLIQPGDQLVIVSDLLAGEALFDSIQVRPIL